MSGQLTEQQREVLWQLLEKGLPLVPQPYAELARQAGCSEQQTLEQAQAWQEQGLFRRFGIVVKHRALGINANCMLVLDIPDGQVDAIGEILASSPGVNLCYQRPRRSNWPYNLFCMVHGRCREAVTRHVARLLAQHDLAQRPHHLLFSTRAFKQRGARYSMPEVGND